MRLVLARAGVIGVLAATVCFPAAAVEPSGSGSRVSPETTRENLTLVTTTIVQSNLKGRTIAPDRIYELHPRKTIACPNGGPACHVEALTKVEVGGTPDPNNPTRFGVCLVVDGNAACPHDLVLAGDGQSETVVNFSQGLKAGAHTVTTGVVAEKGITEKGIKIYEFGVSYHLYK